MVRSQSTERPEAPDENIQLEEDGYDSDVEIIRVKLFDVGVEGGRIAVTQAIALFKALKRDLGPQSS